MELSSAEGAAAAIVIVFIVLISVVGLIVYILPGIIASLRRHPQALPIWLVTIFLGGTGIGWLVALIWAFVTPERPTMTVTMAMPSPPPYPPAVPPAAAPSTAPAMADEIAALARLRDQGVLTEAEFTARKRLLLGEVAAPSPPSAEAV